MPCQIPSNRPHLPSTALRARPRRRFPPEVLSHDEVLALMDACGAETVTGVRNRALLAVLYRAGLRITEAMELRPKDLNLSQGMIRVLFAKGGKARTVGIDAVAARIVCEWLTAREQWGAGGVADLTLRSPLFCTRSGRRLTGAYMRRLLPELARKAGIAKRVHAHGFRHTHAAQLRSEGVDIGIISKQLGHTSITTTARYLDHIAPMAVVDALRNRTW